MSDKPMDLQHATDSTIAKASARILMPIMVALLSLALTVLGVLIMRSWDSTNTAIDKLSTAQQTTGVQVVEIDKKVSLMAQRVDQMLIKQVDNNSDKVEDHERRLEQLERVVPQP